MLIVDLCQEGLCEISSCLKCVYASWRVHPAQIPSGDPTEVPVQPGCDPSAVGVDLTAGDDADDERESTEEDEPAPDYEGPELPAADCE